MLKRGDWSIMAALAALGSLVVHQLAYLAVYPVEAQRAAELADHGHMGTQWALVTPIAVVAAAWFILRQLYGLGLGASLAPWRLAGAVALAFGTQEMIETVLRGETAWSVMTQPAVALGLALAPLVGWAFARILRAAENAVRRLCAASPRPVVAATLVIPRPGSEARPVDRRLRSGPTRGPPLVRC